MNLDAQKLIIWAIIGIDPGPKRLPFLETNVTPACDFAFSQAQNEPDPFLRKQLTAAALQLCPLVENDKAAWRSNFYITYQPF